MPGIQSADDDLVENVARCAASKRHAGKRARAATEETQRAMASPQKRQFARCRDGQEFRAGDAERA